MFMLQKNEENLNTLISYVNNFNVIKPEDIKFLQEKKDHLAKVFENVHIWRTDSQKEMIIADENHATLHSKFHQAILEQKVQLDQALYLAKDFEMKKIEIEELNTDLEEIEYKLENNTDSFIEKRLKTERKKKEIEIQFKTYELKQMEIAMHYRMDEVKGWQAIEERLLEQMKKQGIDEDIIWNKNSGEIESMFFEFLLKYHGISKTTDGAEAHNLYSLAKFACRQAKEAGIFDKLLARCNSKHIDALIALGEISKQS